MLLFRDILDRYGDGAGPAAMNGLIAAYIAAKRYKDAEDLLLDATTKDPLYPETLANTAALAAIQGRSDIAAKALAQLKRVAPTHAILEIRDMAEGQFDRVAETFSS